MFNSALASTIRFNIYAGELYVTCSGKRYISAQKLNINLLASKESTKLVLSNDAIVALVAAPIFAP